jgi:hypothetical protein
LAGLTFANAAQEQNAELDYILGGGNTALAAEDATLSAGTTTANVVQGPPPILYGISTTAPTSDVGSSASPPAPSSPVAFEAFRTGSDVDTTVLNWTVVDTGAVQSVEAADYPGGVLPSGQVTLESGVSLVSFNVPVPLELRLPTESLEVQISSPPAETLTYASNSATETLYSAVPVEGTDAAPSLYLASGIGTLTGSGTDYTLNLGDVGADGTTPDVIGIQNDGPGYADALNGVLFENGPFQLGGNTFFTEIGGGGASNFTIAASTQLGSEVGTVVISPSENNSSGYQAVLPSITLTTIAYVTDPIATPSPLPDVLSVSGRIGGLLTPSLQFANDTTTVGSDDLAVSITDVGGNVLAPNTAAITPGGTITATLSDIAAAPGTFTDTLDVGYVSFDPGSTTGTPLPGATVTLEGTSYQDAAPILSGTTFDFGTVHQGDPAPTVSVGLNNDNTPGVNSDDLFADLGSVGPFSGDGLVDVAAGQTGSLVATLSTAAGGVFDDTGTVTFASHDNQFADAGLPSQQVTLEGTVIGDAAPAFDDVGGAGSLTQTGADTWVYDFGTVYSGSSPLAAQFDLANTASPPADSFTGLLTIGGQMFANTGVLDPGGTSATYEQDFSTAAPGTFSEVVLLTPTDSVVGILPADTLTIQGDVVANPACYCRGTLILTDSGELPVEELEIGSLVMTHRGELRRVKWIGRRSYAGRFLAANPGVQPVRFAAGSLGDGLPRRELRVSPMHAMFLDGLLVPASMLVNGAGIVRLRGLDRVDYIHVELDTHDVILAEGSASETFVDDESRMAFHNASDYFARYGEATVATAVYCAPRVTDGYALEAIRDRLSPRAARG